MVGAHAADVNGLDAADAAVILDLHACEVPQRVGDTVAVETLQFVALQGLHRNHVLRLIPGCDNKFLQVAAGGVGPFGCGREIGGRRCGTRYQK